jgi:hypothetical protein
MVVVQDPKAPGTVDEPTLMALTGTSGRNLTRWRQQGLILPVEPRRGLGRGRGTTSLRYPYIAVSTIKRLNELRREFKDVGEWRWRLWLEGYPVRIAPDLAATLDQFGALISTIKTVDDIETKMSARLWKWTDMPRGNPLRRIFRDLEQDDLGSLTTMVICVVLGIRLPLFDEPNPAPFQVFKRAFGLPTAWEMPPGLFDVFPRMRDQIQNALAKATADELEVARTVCQFLSPFLDNPKNRSRGGIAVDGIELSSRPIELASLLWQLSAMRGATVGLILFGMRGIKSALGEEGGAALASMAGDLNITWPEFA